MSLSLTVLLATAATIVDATAFNKHARLHRKGLQPYYAAGNSTTTSQAPGTAPSFSFEPLSTTSSTTVLAQPQNAAGLTTSAASVISVPITDCAAPSVAADSTSTSTILVTKTVTSAVGYGSQASTVTNVVVTQEEVLVIVKYATVYVTDTGPSSVSATPAAQYATQATIPSSLLSSATPNAAETTSSLSSIASTESFASSASSSTLPTPLLPYYSNSTVAGNSTNSLVAYAPGGLFGKTTTPKKHTTTTTKRTTLHKTTKTSASKNVTASPKKYASTSTPTTRPSSVKSQTTSTTSSIKPSAPTTKRSTTTSKRTTTTSAGTSSIVTSKSPSAQIGTITVSTMSTTTQVAPVSTASDTIKTCNSYYTVVSGDWCSKFVGNYGITVAQFEAWNPSVGSSCLIYPNQAYCVGVSSSASSGPTSASASSSTSSSGLSSSSSVTTTTTTISSASPVTTSAAPTATDTVANCKQFYTAVSGDYCYKIDQAYGITEDQFISWNPSVGSSCSIFAGQAYCVSVTSSTPPTTTSAAGSATGTFLSGPTGSPVSMSDYSYYVYNGNGTVAAGWPAPASWQTFDTMFSLNMNNLQISCSQFNVPNNSADEIASLKANILKVASESGVDSRFIFAIVMQESTGCVRAPTTGNPLTNAIYNPGLMQTHSGTGSCNQNGVVQTPCPDSEIYQMIKDGTEGTDGSSPGDGLEQTLTEANFNGVARYYRAARIYNGGQGSLDVNNLANGCCTPCYSSDVANRLTGWNSGSTPCKISSS